MEAAGAAEEEPELHSELHGRRRRAAAVVPLRRRRRRQAAAQDRRRRPQAAPQTLVAGRCLPRPLPLSPCSLPVGMGKMAVGRRSRDQRPWCVPALF